MKQKDAAGNYKSRGLEGRPSRKRAAGGEEACSQRRVSRRRRRRRKGGPEERRKEGERSGLKGKSDNPTLTRWVTMSKLSTSR